MNITSVTRRVQIGGESFLIRSDGDPALTEEIAGFVEQQLRVAQKTTGAERFRASILAAMNVAGELWDVRNERDALRQELEIIRGRVEQLSRRLQGEEEKS